MEENKKYFTVVRRTIKGEMGEQEVYSDGEVIEDRPLENIVGGVILVVGYTAYEYDEQGIEFGHRYYPVHYDENGNSNVDEVMAQIYNDHNPSEWQNHDS